MPQDISQTHTHSVYSHTGVLAVGSHSVDGAEQTHILCESDLAP